MTKRTKRRERRYTLPELLKILTLWSRTGEPEKRISEDANIRVEATDEVTQVVVTWQSR